MFVAPDAAGGGRQPNQDDMIASFVASLRLETKLDPQHQVSRDLELALHQLETLKTYIWREIDPLVRQFVPILLENGASMDAEHMNDCLHIACDEYVLKGHRLLMRRTLEDKSVSLTELTKEVFNPKSKEYGDYRERLKNNTLYRMRDIGLWSFTEEDSAVSKNGGFFHAGFKIFAGPILMAFHHHIYMPWAKHQAKFTYELLNRSGGH